MKEYWLNFPENHPRYIKYVRRYTLALLLLMLFDVHKYGSWITGDATYWYPFSFWLVPLLLLPLLPWGISSWITWAERSGRQYTYKFILLWIPGIIALVTWLTDGHIFNPAWYDKGLWGILRTDNSTLAAAGLVIFAAFCIWLYLREGKNPFAE
jgi:hypothetical protein